MAADVLSTGVIERPATAPAPPKAAPAVPRLVSVAVIIGGVLAVILAVNFATRDVRVGSVAGRWAYPYVTDFSWKFLWPLAVAAAAALGLLWLSRRTHAWFEWPTVLGWLAAAVPLQLLMRWNMSEPLSAYVLSDRTNTFFSPTRRWGALEFISNYMGIVDQLIVHARTNMAGKTMFYFLLTEFTSSPAALGVMIMVVSNLGALLAYLIVRDLLVNRRAALYALILFLLVPGKLYFTPILNTVSPVPILLALWLHVRFVKTGRLGYAALLGPALYLTVFFEPTPLPMGIVFIAILGLALRQRTRSGADAARLVAVALATLVATYAAVRLLVGYDLVANFRYVLDDAHGFNSVKRRPYGLWLTRNLWEFTACVGVASLVVIMAGAWEAVRGGIARPAAVLTLAGLAVLATVDLAGINRGETVRHWIFIAGFLQIVAAWQCARTTRMWPIAVLVGASVLQATVGASMIGFMVL